ncbi:MAG: hypothetical protein KBB86_01325 [Candidatus Pacebacteria bacterium]|nr:hypothetical protein [Candidatus Paceibacterota bacterium]
MASDSNQKQLDQDTGSQAYLATLVREAKLKVETETKTLEELTTRAQLERGTIDNLRIKYVNIDKLIEKETDIFFKNPKTAKPEIKVKTKDIALGKSLNTSRSEIEKMLNQWKTEIDQYKAVTNQGSKITSSDLALSDLVKTTEQNIASIESFINQLQNLVNGLSTGPTLTQAQIIQYQSVVSNAMQDLETIISGMPVIISNSSSVGTQPIVTQAQIIAQQVVVEQVISAQNQVQAQIESESNNNQSQQNQNSINEVTPPIIVLTSPVAGSVISYTVPISASASDSSGISRVEFYNESNLIGSDTTSPYSISYNTNNVADGKYGLLAKAYDAVGNSKVSTLVLVTISNGGNSNDGINQSVDPELIEGANQIGF